MSHEPRRAWTTASAWPLYVVLGVALSAGCASSTPNPFAEGVGSPRNRQLIVWVRSAHRNAVDITLLGGGGQRVELGRLDGRRTETFRVQWHDNLIRARIEAVAGRVFTTQPIVWTNQVAIVIVIAATLDRSSISAN